MDTAKSNCKLDPVPDISPDVDVVLVVGPRNLRLIIQSQVLRCASKVFSAMFGPLGVKGELLDMASTHAQERLLDAAFEHFATSLVVSNIHYLFPTNTIHRLLPLYSGPQVTIRIGSASHEYKLPKALLCKQSPYLAAMFEGPFKEGEEQSTTLEEISIKAAYLTSCQSLVSGLSSTRGMFYQCRRCIRSISTVEKLSATDSAPDAILAFWPSYGSSVCPWPPCTLLLVMVWVSCRNC